MSATKATRKPLPQAGGLACIFGEEALGLFFNFEVFAEKSGQGVADAEGVGVTRAEAVGDEVVGFAKTGRPRRGVVRVGGEEVNPSLLQEFQGHALGGLTLVAGEGIGGDLDEQAASEPVGHALGFVHESLVALGVGEDGGESSELKLVKGLLKVGRGTVVGKFDEEVAEAVDAVAAGVGARVGYVVVREVEVAALAEGDRNICVGEAAAQFLDPGRVDRGIEMILGICVGSADDVSDAVGRRKSSHLDRHLEGFGTVVKTRKKVVVNIYHEM